MSLKRRTSCFCSQWGVIIFQSFRCLFVRSGNSFFRSGSSYMYDRCVFVLFGTGSTHSAVPLTFFKHLKVPSTLLDHSLYISTSIGNIVVIRHEFRRCPLRVGDDIHSANLLPLEMSDFDIILSDGITMDPAKVEAITKWPRPMAVTGAKSFLGLAKYYGRFVEGKLALPLMKLMLKGEKFLWNEEREKSFEELKRD
ncbi:putative reverse transcriptase domain-containing protein [Tanacetum coccineum]|uniref:Reverse transcriptase domain-containing protein n=1 Tax=Tanacetum coccineum TaxID=301880 RepID=A0ABQ4ZLB1_9ASTR